MSLGVSTRGLEPLASHTARGEEPSMARVILSLEELLALAERPLTVHIPELLTLGERIMDAAGQIRQAIDALAVIVETEANEIANMVHPNITQDEVDDIVGRLNTMGDSIRGFAPTPEPPQP